MDSLTHIALGAVIGEAFAGKTLGKRAMLIGAGAQSLPDIDFIAAFWLSPTDNLLAHRGFTHSFLFGIIATAILTEVAARSRWSHNIARWQWAAFLGTEILVHLVLDSLNAYGIGWFEPFSHKRISFDTIFVADPLYSIWLGIAILALFILRHRRGQRRNWILFGLVFSTLYLIYTFINKFSIESEIKDEFARNQIPYHRYFTTPTPFNNWLWYIVAEDDSGFHIGHRSVFDDHPTDFYYFPRQGHLLDSLQDEKDLERLLQFSQGYYTVEQWSNDTLVFNDLRFGQIVGWYDPRERFVFHYFLRDAEGNALDNRLVLQRGRFAKWNQEAIRALIWRIRGLNGNPVKDSGEKDQ
jgi:inner membrane protein